MRMLHTADWHLGRTLFGRKRYDEFGAFLSWLTETAKSEKVDVLVVAGDIFDTTTPTHRAQELYYRFLVGLSGSPVKHVVVTGGNHDSPSFLEAPKEILRLLSIHVVGAVSQNPDQEVLVLKNSKGEAQMIVAAVPYLRDRDLRLSESGETVEDKDVKLREGLRKHYAEVCSLAEAERLQAERSRESTPSAQEIPLVALGHLFTAGGKTVEGDGVRDLYVGSLAHVEAEVFPRYVDYVALGHLHVPQSVADLPNVRYSGSPLPLGFGEVGQEKSVCLIDFQGRKPATRLVPIPVFQELASLRGNWESLEKRIGSLAKEGSGAWLEVIYEGSDLPTDLRAELDRAIEGTKLEVLRVKNQRVFDKALGRGEPEESLDDLKPEEVFSRCLDANEVPEDQKDELWAAFRETLVTLEEVDPQAE